MNIKELLRDHKQNFRTTAVKRKIAFKVLQYICMPE